MTRWFEFPWALTAIAAVPLIAALRLRQVWREAFAFQAWPRLNHELRQQRGGVWPVAFLLVGLTCLAIAVAGPRFGPAISPELRAGRDLCIVVDVSRSMLAEQPSRIAKATRALRSLAETLGDEGTGRVSLIAFAAQPRIVFPLTRDFGHLRFAIGRIAAGDFPREVRPEENAAFISGTRLGAALTLAVESFPDRRPGAREILLLSDGDDPVDDDEWLAGVTAARTAGIPVHVVAVGEPGVEFTIPHRGDSLRFDGELVRTRVNLERLKEIATRTRGQSFDLPKGSLPLGPLLAAHWRTLPTLDDGESATDAFAHVPAVRWPWLIAAFAGWIIHGTRLSFRRRPRTAEAVTLIGSLKANPLAAVGVAFLALMAVGGESWTDWIDKGDRAFEKQDYEEALAIYRKAEVDALDPGLVSFNIGATCYRLKRFGEAERHYRRALDDDAIPAERRDRAWFDLGNALLQQAQTDRRLIEQAMTAYRHCLEGPVDAALRRDAEFNLELAGRRWRLAKPPPPDQGNDNAPPDPPTPKNGSDDPPPQAKKGGTNSLGDPKKDGSKSNAEDPDGSGDSKRPNVGPVTVLPDNSERAPMSPAEAEAHLDQQLTRILRDVRGYRDRTEPAPRGKDW